MPSQMEKRGIGHVSTKLYSLMIKVSTRSSEGSVLMMISKNGY